VRPRFQLLDSGRLAPKPGQRLSTFTIVALKAIKNTAVGVTAAF